MSSSSSAPSWVTFAASGRKPIVFRTGAFGSVEQSENAELFTQEPQRVSQIDLGAAGIHVHEREALEVQQLPAVVAEVVRGLT